MLLRANEKLGSCEITRLRKIAFTFAACAVFGGWLVSAGLAQTTAPKIAPTVQSARAAESTQRKKISDAGKAALSRELSSAASRGDTPSVVALIVGRDGVL